MAADAPPGPKNQPRFLGTGAPATAADENAISDYAAKVGNRKEGTAADRALLAGTDVWNGLEYFETDTGREYVRHAGSWIMSFARIIGRVNRSDAVSSFGAGAYSNAAANANWTADTAVGISAYDNGWTIPVTGRYLVSYDLRANGLFLAGFTVNYAGAAPNLQGMATGSPVQNAAAAASPATPLLLNQGDVIRPYLLSNAGSLNLLRSSDVAGGGFFAVIWIGGA